MDFNALMQQAQRMSEQMQSEMKRRQEQLAGIEYLGRAGGGLVEVTITGRLSVKRIRVDRNLMRDDPEMAEDLIAAACNDGLNKAQEAQGDSMKQALGGMNLPPGFKLPY